MDGPIEGARDLVLAIFRLAAADYLGISYWHDEPRQRRQIGPVFRADAESFLTSGWAARLADSINISPGTIWAEARRLDQASGRTTTTRLAA